MWDIAGDNFGSFDEVGKLDVANLLLDEPEWELVSFTDDGDGDQDGDDEDEDFVEVGSS